MKKTYILILGAIATLTSCGMIARSSSSDDGHRFNDGIYESTPSFRTKEEKAAAKSENEALVSKTKESPIYLFGDRKDTIMIPDNFSARIQYDQKVGGTVVTVGEDPYDWRWDLENRYGYWYGPYSIGNTWHWNRYYSPYCSPYWNPYRYSWGYHGFYDPWYYGGFYDPWYYGGFYDPWYWGGYHAGCWGWHDPWHHHYHHGWYKPHHHGPAHIGGPAGGKGVYHGLRSQTEKSFTSSGRTVTHTGSTVRTTGGTVRGGMKVGGTASRSSGSTGVRRPTTGTRTSSGTVSRPAAAQYRRPASSQGTYDRQSSASESKPSYSRGTSYERSSSYSRSSSYGSSSSGSYSRGGSGNYGGSSGSYSRGGSSGGSGYSRSSSGGYRR